MESVRPDFVLHKVLADLRQRIIDNMNAAGAYATGKTEQSLHIEVEDDGVGVVGTLSARPYFSALETGTRPWRVQYRRPPKFFVDIIREWAEAKGVSAPAGAIAMTIMREGSRLYRQGGRDNIYSNEIPNAIASAERQLAAYWEVQMVEMLDKTIR